MLFDIAQNQSFSDVVFDTFEFHKKYDDFLILTNNGKVGLFKLRESMDTETAAVIKPIYDSFETFDYLRSIDENYDRFILYYFKKDGQLYPVGVNGIKYFQE